MSGTRPIFPPIAGVKKSSTFRPGECIIMTSEEGIDFHVTAIVVARRMICLEDLAKQYIEQYDPNESRWHNKPHPIGFLDWLCALDYVMRISMKEIHLGSYGELKVTLT